MYFDQRNAILTERRAQELPMHLFKCYVGGVTEDKASMERIRRTLARWEVLDYYYHPVYSHKLLKFWQQVKNF
jgi:hypothetical protein